jgi:hypothetical protein
MEDRDKQTILGTIILGVVITILGTGATHYLNLNGNKNEVGPVIYTSEAVSPSHIRTDSIRQVVTVQTIYADTVHQSPISKTDTSQTVTEPKSRLIKPESNEGSLCITNQAAHAITLEITKDSKVIETIGIMPHKVECLEHLEVGRYEWSCISSMVSFGRDPSCGEGVVNVYGDKTAKVNVVPPPLNSWQAQKPRGGYQPLHPLR